MGYELPSLQTTHLQSYRLSDFTIHTSATDTNAKQGTHGVVLHAHRKSDNTPVVLKKYKYFDIQSCRDKIHELVILRNLNQYPQTKSVRLYGYIFETNSQFRIDQMSFEDTFELFAVMEPLDASLLDIIRQPKKPTEYLRLFYQILSALDAIHTLGYLHGDIKPDNIMMKGNDIRIIDYGFSTFIGINPTLDVAGRYGGTPAYRPADVRDHPMYVSTNHISYTTDSYVVGLVFISLLLRQQVYSYYEPHTDRIRVFFLQYTLQGSQIQLTAENINRQLEHPFAYDLFRGLLEPNIKTRWTCKQALQHPMFDSFRKRSPPLLAGGGVKTARRSLRTLYNTHYVGYTKTGFRHPFAELQYAPDLFQTYGTFMIRIPSIRATSSRIPLFDNMIEWILRIADQTQLSFDSLFNCIYQLRQKLQDKRLFQTQSHLRLYAVSYLDVYTTVFQGHHIPYSQYIVEGMDETTAVASLKPTKKTTRFVSKWLKWLGLRSASMSPSELHNLSVTTTTNTYTEHMIFIHIFKELLPSVDITVYPAWSLLQYCMNGMEYAESLPVSKLLRETAPIVALVFLLNTSSVSRSFACSFYELAQFSILKTLQLWKCMSIPIPLNKPVRWLPLSPTLVERMNAMWNESYAHLQASSPTLPYIYKKIEMAIEKSKQTVDPSEVAEWLKRV
jgi:serine/threonine protein kinase